ncbi:MAG: hypothetical protein IKH45_04865 [Neisseriaceae bacterium]|nr:hypothetical protein [Neisseriaceae bacterium]MBR3482198.1 hypothetical protein [Neisseriaceae bacterium]
MPLFSLLDKKPFLFENGFFISGSLNGKKQRLWCCGGLETHPTAFVLFFRQPEKPKNIL